MIWALGRDGAGLFGRIQAEQMTRLTTALVAVAHDSGVFARSRLRAIESLRRLRRAAIECALHGSAAAVERSAATILAALGGFGQLREHEVFAELRRAGGLARTRLLQYFPRLLDSWLADMSFLLQLPAEYRPDGLRAPARSAALGGDTASL